MSQNLSIQKRKLIREGSILGGILLVLGLLAGGSDYMASSNETQITALQAQFNSNMSLLTDLENKYQMIKESVDEYTHIKQQITDGFYTLDREKAQEVLARIGKQHRIDKINTQMSPIETYATPEATFQRADVQFSDVRLSFQAMSDMHVYALVDSLMKELPGIKKITGLSISAVKPFSNELLLEMGAGKRPEMVNAEITFLWMGIRLFPVDAAGNPIPPAPGAQP